MIIWTLQWSISLQMQLEYRIAGIRKNLNVIGFHFTLNSERNRFSEIY